MSEKVLAEELRGALEALREAIEEHAMASVRRMRAKEAFEEAMAHALLAGAIQGRNEEERKARARMLLADHYRELAEAEEALIWARARLDGARYRFEGLNTLAYVRREVME